MEKIRLLCIGDSHSAGYPDHDLLYGGNPESSYQFWLAKELGKMGVTVTCSCINKGICGDTTGGIVNRLGLFLQKDDIDVVILQGGSNDLGCCDGQKVVENLRYGCTLCCEKGVSLVLATVPPTRFLEYVTMIKRINQGIRSLGKHYSRVVVADLFAVLEDHQGMLDEACTIGDGVHLNIEGYRRMGKIIASAISDAHRQATSGR